MFAQRSIATTTHESGSCLDPLVEPDKLNPRRRRGEYKAEKPVYRLLTSVGGDLERERHIAIGIESGGAPGPHPTRQF